MKLTQILKTEIISRGFRFIFHKIYLFFLSMIQLKLFLKQMKEQVNPNKKRSLSPYTFNYSLNCRGNKKVDEK